LNKFSFTVVSEVFNKNVNFQCAFDENLSLTHVFIQQIFRVPEEVPPAPSPLPKQGSAGGGGEVDLFIL
jgi:hypothetical protein